MQLKNGLKGINVKISVIIPVYNCEQYIKECLGSVLNQTISETEVICIDDGSTDNSLNILESYKYVDERIIVLTQTNQGAGAARNKGLKYAEGEYVAFLDADDYYMDQDALGKMYKTCLETGVSVCGSFRKKNENGIEKEDKLFGNKEFGVVKKEVYQYKDFQMDYDYQSFIFNRKFLVDNNIAFPDYCRFQDPPFMVRAMYAAQKFAIADTYLYCYRMPNMPLRFTVDKVKDLLKGLIDNLAFSSEHHLEILFVNTLERLEYEYKDIILHNLSSNDAELLELLLKASEIAGRETGKKHYMVRPLQLIMQACICQTDQYDEGLATWLHGQNEIVIYGAGKLARAFIKYLEKKNMKNIISKIVVSQIRGNEENLEGIQVIDISNFRYENRYVLVAVGAKSHREIENILNERGITKYLLLDNVFLNSLV